MSGTDETAPVGQDSTQQWSVLAANAIGASHQATGRPGQDAFSFAPSDHTTDQPLTVAVADGHGHRIHFRSKEGSRFAVEIACATVLGSASTLAACRDIEEVRTLALGVVLPRVVEAWRAACQRDLQARPVTVEELEAVGFPEEERAGALDEHDPLLAYGSTLMFAGLAGPWLLLAHIGDGDIFTVEADGTSAIPVPGDPLLDGQRTTSLCQPDALGSFRIAVLDLHDRSPVVVALATDGYGNAQSSDVWQPGVGADLVRYLRAEGRTWIGHQLPDWVARCASVEGSADDTTMALLISPRAEQRASAVAAHSPTHPDSDSNGHGSTASTLLATPETVAAVSSARERTLPMAPSELPALPVTGWPSSPAPAPGAAFPGPPAPAPAPPGAHRPPDGGGSAGAWGWPGNAAAAPRPPTAAPSAPPGPAKGQLDPRLRGRMVWIAAGALALLVAVVIAVIVMTGGTSAGKGPGVTPLLPGVSTTTAPGASVPATVSPTSSTVAGAAGHPDSGRKTAGQAGSSVGSVASTATTTP